MTIKNHRHRLDLQLVYEQKEEIIRLNINHCYRCGKINLPLTPQFCYGQGVSLQYYLCSQCIRYLNIDDYAMTVHLSHIDEMVNHFEIPENRNNILKNINESKKITP